MLFQIQQITRHSRHLDSFSELAWCSDVSATATAHSCSFHGRAHIKFVALRFMYKLWHQLLTGW